MILLASKDRRKTPSKNGDAHLPRFKVTDTDPPKIDSRHGANPHPPGWAAVTKRLATSQFGNDGFPVTFPRGTRKDPSPPDRLQTGQDISGPHVVHPENRRPPRRRLESPTPSRGTILSSASRRRGPEVLVLRPAQIRGG